MFLSSVRPHLSSFGKQNFTADLSGFLNSFPIPAPSGGKEQMRGRLEVGGAEGFSEKRRPPQNNLNMFRHSLQL